MFFSGHRDKPRRVKMHESLHFILFIVLNQRGVVVTIKMPKTLGRVQIVIFFIFVFKIPDKQKKTARFQNQNKRVIIFNQGSIKYVFQIFAYTQFNCIRLRLENYSLVMNITKLCQ